MVAFRNLVVFMTDGLRWDHHPEAIRDIGVTARTIASSLHTPSSIASLLTGRYLPHHGIRGFTDTLPASVPTILDAFEHAGISAESGNFNNEIYGYLLHRYDPTRLADIEEPFAWFVRDPGGHAPLDDFDAELATNSSVQSYLENYGGDEERIRADYERAVASSVDRFHTRVIETLEDRGIREDTLVVFISDHGELLGEYGHVGESHPATPEIVRVPTTFVHPDLSARELPDLMRHIDLPATVGDLGTVSVPDTDGTSAFGEATPAYGLNFYDRPYPSLVGTFNYTLSSVWDWNGGYVFNNSSLWDRLKLLGGYAAKIPAGIHVRRARNPIGIKLLLDSSYSWGEPEFSKAEARARLEKVSVTVDDDSDLNMSEETRENLKDLGYL